MDTIATETWIQACAHSLQKHWRTVSPEVLEEVARELLESGQLQPMSPAEAAALWLRPVTSTADSAQPTQEKQRTG